MSDHFNLHNVDPTEPGFMELVGGPHDGAVLEWGKKVSVEPWIAVDHDGDGQDMLVVFVIPAMVQGRAHGYGLGLLPLVEGEGDAWPRRVHVPGVGWVPE